MSSIARTRVSCAVHGNLSVLAVEDNGGGLLPPGFEEHVLEPFETTKPKGIALGLTTAHQAMGSR